MRETRPLPPPREVAGGAFRARIKLGQRAVFLGHTGSGKSMLATRILEALPPRLAVVVIDPKRDFTDAITPGSGWEIHSDLPPGWERQTRRRKKPSHLRVIIQPEFMQDHTKDARLNELYRRIFANKRCVVYLDEIQRLTRERYGSAELAQLVQMGRSKFISVWGSTLRPSGIPRYFISESDHVFLFRLRDAADRDRASEIVGERAEEPPWPGEHDFYYRPPGTELLDPILVHQ